MPARPGPVTKTTPTRRVNRARVNLGAPYTDAMLQGFKDFIMKGNVIDLAVAVVIGAAFGKVVTAIVDSVLMPLIAALFNAPSFDEWLVLDLNGVAVRFGVVLTALVNFLLIAAAIYFLIVAPMNTMIERRNRRLGIDPAAEETPEDVALLTEIRDLLSAQRGGAAPQAGTVDPRL